MVLKTPSRSIRGCWITVIGVEWAKRSGTKDASNEKGKVSRRHSKSGDDSESSESDVDAEEILDELMAKRAELADSSAKLVEHFGWSLRGGSWTLPAHTSVAYDCFIASPTTSEATAFCHQFGLCRSGNFSIALYGEHNCFLLVRSWVHRMSFLFSLWESFGCRADFKFSGHVLSAYEPPVDMVELLASTNCTVVKRAEGLRDIEPKRAKAT